MKKKMFIHTKYNNKSHDFVYFNIAKLLFGQEVHFEKNKHRDSSTC